jgi:hypothetical protein
MPFTTTDLPLNKLKGEPLFNSYFTIDNIVFFNFNDECKYPSVALSSNSNSNDAYSIHIINNVRFKNIFEKNLIKFKKNDIHEIIGKTTCGNFRCTGLNNIIFNFENILETVDDDIIYTNKNMKKLKTQNLSGINKEKINDINLLSSSLTLTSITDYKNFKESSICKEIPNSESVLCSSDYSASHLIMENIENGARDRALQPVYFTSNNSDFYNKLNAFEDHECKFGYDSLLRTPRFPAMVILKKNEINNYNVSFTSTNPSKLFVQLANKGPLATSIKKISRENGNLLIMKIKLSYNMPMTVLVFKEGKEIKADIFKGNSTEVNLNNQNEIQNLCGKNSWHMVKNLLEFYVTNEPDCKLQLNIVNSVQVSLRYDVSVEEIFL